MFGNTKQGKEQYLVKVDGDTNLRGTEVIFYPDPEIFESLEYHYDILATRMRELSYLNKGLTINMSDERESAKDENGKFSKRNFLF